MANTTALRDFCGSHGRYTFYRSLQYDDAAGSRKQIKIGDFVRIRFEQDDICQSKQQYTAEVQLFWTETRNPFRLSSVRIYYPPAYLPADDNDPSLFGRDELLSLPEKVVLKVEDLIRCIKAAQQDEFVILTHNEYCRYHACLTMCTERFTFACSNWRRSSYQSILGNRFADKRLYFCRKEHDFDQLDELKIRCDELAPSLRGRKRYKQELPNDFKRYLATSCSSATPHRWLTNGCAEQSDGEPQQQQKRVRRFEQPCHVSPYQTRHRARISLELQTAAHARRSFRRNRPALTTLSTVASTTGSTAVSTRKRTSPPSDTKPSSDADVSEHAVLKRKRGRPRKRPLPTLEVDVKTSKVDDDERAASSSADLFSSLEQSPDATSCASSVDDQKGRKCNDKTSNGNESSCLLILPDYSEDKKQFLRNLTAFMDSIGEPLRKEPSLYYTAVDVYELYKLCTGYGGFDKVCKKRLWRSVYRQLGGTSKNAAVSSYLKRIYQRVLLRFEAHERRDGVLTADSVASSVDADSNCNSNSGSGSDEPPQPAALVMTLRKSVRHLRNDACVPDETLQDSAEAPCKRPRLDTPRKSNRSSPATRTPQASRSASRSSSDRCLHPKVENPAAVCKHEPLVTPPSDNDVKNERGFSNSATSSTPSRSVISPAVAGPANPAQLTLPTSVKFFQDLCRSSQPPNVSFPFTGLSPANLPFSMFTNFPLTTETANPHNNLSSFAPWLLPSNGHNQLGNRLTPLTMLGAPNANNMASLLDSSNLHPAFPVYNSPAAYQIPLMLGLLPTADTFNPNASSFAALQNMSFLPAVQLAASQNPSMNPLGYMSPFILSNGYNPSTPSFQTDPVLEYLKLLMLTSQNSFDNSLAQQHAVASQQLRLEQNGLNVRAAGGPLLLPKPSGASHPRAHMTEYEST